MTKVYYLKDKARLEEISGKLLDFYPEDLEIITKIHFGEPGNKAAFKPADIDPIIKALKGKVTLIDTPVAYLSPRHTVLGYNLVVKAKGFQKIAAFKISNHFKEVKTKDLKVEACRELIEAKAVLVISHVKGHPCTGMGGAIKNLGMGGTSIKSKNEQHGLSKPEVNDQCTGCGTCVPVCPGKALKVKDGKISINKNSCWGCSTCEIVCPQKALKPKAALFDDLIAQAAGTLINNFPKKTYYINFLTNIVKFCDCSSHPGEKISEDAGILFSENPVAIDKASLDILARKNGEDVFKKVHHKDPVLHLKFASEYTGKSLNYSLVEV